MIPEGIILLRVQHLQQRRGGVAPVVRGELVDLVEHHERVAGARLDDAADDASGHGADVGAAMPADLRLVVYAAEGDAAKLPVLTPSDRVPDVKQLHVSFPENIIKDGGFAAAVVTGDAEYAASDTGLTQALDKAVGAALLKKADLSASALVISGKTSADVVRKALFAGISLIVSKYPATTLAKSIADAGHAAVVCEPSL